MALTLPIVAGKKYVRRDGEIAEVVSYTPSGNLFILGTGENGYVDCGRLSKVQLPHRDFPADLVADYIEPAKGHPHAEERCYGFKVGVRYVFTKPLVIPPGGLTAEQVDKAIADGFGYEAVPDPHAESAAEYAKDMAETNKAWERWEKKPKHYEGDLWRACFQHPEWDHDVIYRRK